MFRKFWPWLIGFAIKMAYRKSKRDMRLLVHIRYKTNEERYKRILLAPHLYNQMLQSFAAAENMREVRVYQELFSHHKSYADDFPVDPSWLKAMSEAKPFPKGL